MTVTLGGFSLWDSSAGESHQERDSDALSGGVRPERERRREREGLGCAEWRRSAGEREREGGRGTRMRGAEAFGPRERGREGEGLGCAELRLSA